MAVSRETLARKKPRQRQPGQLPAGRHGLEKVGSLANNSRQTRSAPVAKERILDAVACVTGDVGPGEHPHRAVAPLDGRRPTAVTWRVEDICQAAGVSR